MKTAPRGETGAGEVYVMKIGIIGAGKVGFSLGKFFAVGGLELAGYWSRSEESAREAAEFTGSRAYENLESLVRGCGAIFFTTPDGAITETYVCAREFGISGKFLCHCSGSLTAADAFPGSAERGAGALSLHPLFPVSSKYESYKELQNALFCIEGDCEPAAYFRSALEKLGAKTQLIPSEGKARYHAGCVMASNFMCALAREAAALLVSCGFTSEGAIGALAPLMRSNLEHIIADGPEAALTGPVERCDAATVRRHLENITEPKRRLLYKALSASLVEMAERRHTGADYGEIKKLTEITEQELNDI